MNKLYAYQIVKNFDKIIFDSSLDEFIDFAKNYNIFQQSDNKFYLDNCKKIRERLVQENLSENIIKSENINND